MEVTRYTLELLNLKRGGDVMPPRSKKYFRSTKSGAGMTAAGVAKYRRDNPGNVKHGYIKRYRTKVICEPLAISLGFYAVCNIFVGCLVYIQMIAASASLNKMLCCKGSAMITKRA